MVQIQLVEDPLVSSARVDPYDGCILYDVGNNEAIVYASQNGHVEVVQLLMSDVRVIPSGSNSETIRLVSQNGHVDVVKLLLRVWIPILDFPGKPI